MPVPAPVPSDDSYTTEDALDGAAPAPAPSDDYFITYASALDSALPAAAPAASPVAAPAAGPLSGPLDFFSLVGTGAPMPAVGALPCCQSTTQKQSWQHATWRLCMAGAPCVPRVPLLRLWCKAEGCGAAVASLSIGCLGRAEQWICRINILWSALVQTWAFSVETPIMCVHCIASPTFTTCELGSAALLEPWKYI